MDFSGYGTYHKPSKKKIGFDANTMKGAGKRDPESEIGADSKRKKLPLEDEFTVSGSEDAKDILNGMKHVDPVVQLHLAKEVESPDIRPTSKNLLESLIFPLSPSDFKSGCFRKKAVYVRSNRNDRALDISSNFMFELNPKQIFEETSSDSIFLWIPSQSNKDGGGASNSTSNGGINNKQPQSLQSIDIQDPNSAYILHKHSKYASYCRAPPELEQRLVSSMLRNVGLGLGQYDPTGEKVTTLGRGEVETFIGTEGHLTGWHTDFQENFTIQLSGRKKWTLKQGTVDHPIRGTTPHYRSSPDVIENQIKIARLSNPDYQFGNQDLDSNAFGNEVEVVMDAGDVLYFPAGMWHKVETIQEGVSINISLMGTTYASLVCGALEQLLLQRDEWREVICTDDKAGDDVVRKLKRLVNELPSVIQGAQRSGFSDGIVPPVLRNPPVFESVDNKDDIEAENEDETSDLGDNENALEDKSSSDIDDQRSSSSQPANVDSFSVEEDDEEIIDLDEFELPKSFVSIRRCHHDCWRRNPLASLTRMEDIKSYFEANDCQSTNNKNLFVLNVNFAGNEVHESAVRVLLRDFSGQLEHLCSLQGNDLDTAIKKMKNPPDALLYYGYIV